MINHHYPILNQCSSHHQPVDFSSTYPKLRVTCPSCGQHNQQDWRVFPKRNQAPKPPKPWKWSSGWSSHFFTEVLGYLGLTIPLCCPPATACHQGDHPAVFHTNQAIPTPAFNMSWPFCTVRVVSLAKCCNCLSTCAVFRRIRRWECGLRSSRRWRYFKWSPLA